MDGATALVLDKTIFHPQGGGQPADTCTISVGDVVFAVTTAKEDRATGIVTHMGHFTAGSLTDLFQEGMTTTPHGQTSTKKPKLAF
jgi:Ser-tRNA(Ala) deacylase AlaX